MVVETCADNRPQRPSGKFTFPLDFAGTHIPTLDNKKICVVSVIGKSSFNDKNCKAVEIDGLLNRSIFQSAIEGYHDVDNNVLYLHMVSATDTKRLVDLCKSLETGLQSKGFLHVWAELKCSQANQLLFLFLVSHIILVVHPVPTFDVSYVHLFKTLDTIRQKAHSFVCEVLRDCSVSGDWSQAGRPCCPRVLFLFRSSNLESLSDDSGKITSVRSNKKFSPLKKLEHALEDQIYRILRKSRIITNISMNSLFAIPANQEFVHVQCGEGNSMNTTQFYLERLQEHCLGLPVGLCERASLSQVDNRKRMMFNDSNETENRLKNFIGKHLELAFTKGFDDSVGRHSGTSVFQLPSGTTWMKVTTKLYNLFNDKDNETISKEVTGLLRSQIDIDGRFSEARCSKVLPVATAAYQEGLPSHYSLEVHQSRVTQAYRMFTMHARGPCFERYALQLQEECEKFWKNGHQLCEVRSLTGNPCLKPIHRLPTDPEDKDTVPEGKIPLPVTCHCSQVKLMSVCNCGRKQCSRDDPFDSKAANYDFYEQLSKMCCIELDRHVFPVFQPSISDYKAAEITMGQWISTTIGSQKHLAPRMERELSAIAPTMSLALSLGQSLGTNEDASGRLSTHPESSPQDTDRSEEPDLSTPDMPEACASSDKESDKILIRQMSTTEYLPGMLHSESPAGLLPTFPSWSLVCLGPSSLYSHNIGIHDQPNFISGTNFLLPWDVTVKCEKDRWPTLAETSSRAKGQHIPLKGKKSGREFTVKIFLGVEYECPRGHRFMCSAPDKILKASGSGLVKENAGKITSSDMPLHYPCPCRSGKPVVAQLMRVHVVTPKAPVNVTLDPKVQPAPSSTPCPVFYPGNQEPIKLTQSTYWVLRLPFIYEGDDAPFLPPKDKKIPNYGRLLKGMYGVTQANGANI